MGTDFGNLFRVCSNSGFTETQLMEIPSQGLAYWVLHRVQWSILVGPLPGGQKMVDEEVVEVSLQVVKIVEIKVCFPTFAPRWGIEIMVELERHMALET